MSTLDGFSFSIGNRLEINETQEHLPDASSSIETSTALARRGFAVFDVA
jgi:hypothetical protein